MTPIAELTAILMAAGMPAEQVAHALDLAQQHADAQSGIRRQSADESAERRRAYDRERQRKVREIRRQSADNPPTVTTPLILTSSTDLNTEKEKKENKRPPRRCHGPIPDGWLPPPRAVEIATELRLEVPPIEARFRDYLASSGKQYADYDAAFCNFVRNTPQFSGRNGNGNAKTGGSISEAAGRLATTGLVFGPRPSGVLSPESAANVRLLEAGRSDQPGDHGASGGVRPLRISGGDN